MSELTPVGLAAFDSLRTEYEPWLRQAFVSTPAYETIAGMRSVVIFGEAGTGKTALREALIWHSTGPDGCPTRLLVHWQPKIAGEIPPGPAGIEIQLDQIFDDCALAITQFLAAYPEKWSALPDWSRGTLTWFVQKYMQGDINVRLGLLRERSTPQAGVVLDELTSRAVQPVLYDDARIRDVTAELAKALVPLGQQGIWIVADGLESQLAYRDQLVQVLMPFLSALSIFEFPQQIAYKLFIPAELKADLTDVSGIDRRRIASVDLKWDIPRLIALVDRRLVVATGQADFTLSKLCSGKGFQKWLEKTGGTNPRDWLDQVRPLVEHYLDHGGSKPLATKTWTALIDKRPPRLLIDENERRVFVGGREIPSETLSEDGYNVLWYLYQRKGQVVSKAELYYLVKLQQPSVPRTTENKLYSARPAYEGVMDTLILRLRKAIEPDPGHPVLLTTVRGRGLRLNVRW